MNADWLHRLRRGAGLLFWSQLAAFLLTNLYGFLVPILGGSHGSLKWGSLVYAMASVPALVGVFALSSRGPQDGLGQPFNKALRLACMILATLELLRSIIRTVLSLLFGYDYTFELEPSLDYVGPLAVVAVLMYFRQLARSLGADRLGRSFGTVVCVYAVLTLADYLFFESALRPLGGNVYLFWLSMWAAFFIFTAVGIWCLVLIARFRRRVSSVIAGYCGNCEYDLTGNESGVCPECGKLAGQLIHQP